ncbi:MAG: hypothetical protein AAGA08_03145 [Pseudomonadota bacterium]
MLKVYVPAAEGAMGQIHCLFFVQDLFFGCFYVEYTSRCVAGSLKDWQKEATAQGLSN